MADLTDINDAIAEAATTPKSVTNGETTVTERSADELIALRNAAASQQAATTAPFGIRRAKIRSPGAV